MGVGEECHLWRALKNSRKGMQGKKRMWLYFIYKSIDLFI